MHIRGSHMDVRARGLGSLAGLGSLGAGTPGGAVAVQMKKYGWVGETPDPPVTGSRPPDEMIFSDPYGYLHTVVDNADWPGVARWYATQINEILQRSVNPSEFWALSNLKIGGGSNASRSMTKADFAAFTRHVVFPYIILDLGNKVGFGIANGIGGQLGQLAAFTDTSSSSGQISWRAAADNFARYGNGTMNLGWVKEPSDHLASRIIVAIGVGIMTAGAASALLAPAAGAAGGTGGGAVGATGGAVGSAASIVPAGIETVIVTAAPAVLTAGGIAAGAAAGGAVVAASPPPVIETVTTIASALPGGATAGTIGAGVASGALVAVATAPPIFDGSSVIETVTTTAQAPSQIQVSPAEGAATGLTTVGITQPTIDVSQPQAPEIEDDKSLIDKAKDLWDQYGDLIDGLLGTGPKKNPNQDSLPSWLDPTGGIPNPGVLDYLKSPLVWGPLLIIAAAGLAATSRKKRRRKRK